MDHSTKSGAAKMLIRFTPNHKLLLRNFPKKSALVSNPPDNKWDVRTKNWYRVPFRYSYANLNAELPTIIRA